MPLPPGQETHAALLFLHLIGTGKKNMVAEVVPTSQFLQQTATGEATLLRRVTLGNDTYDMTSFGNDLGPLFHNGGASSTMPKFEIDISVAGNFFPTMPPPPPRPASVTFSTSSGDIAD
ncbi:hypothetical protein CEP54_016161 [Fusarium duplospermum]|uniref:Uncharacterized protein n=1 Tax=Fusarium duplospermum TaxID=1325734 RepID=A0A428NHN1_9HYPO|nr:hypothetical protein CEP54_016161 [Fusarium duplospermum]